MTKNDEKKNLGGRPKKYPNAKKVMVYLSEENAEQLKKLGGSTWLNSFLNTIPK